MRIEVDQIKPIPGGTVWLGGGADEEGVKVTFLGDWRAMKGLAEEIAAGGLPVMAQLDDWQLWGAV